MMMMTMIFKLITIMIMMMKIIMNNIMTLRYFEQILPVPEPLAMSRFHCKNKNNDNNNNNNNNSNNDNFIQL